MKVTRIFAISLILIAFMTPVFAQVNPPTARSFVTKYSEVPGPVQDPMFGGNVVVIPDNWRSFKPFAERFPKGFDGGNNDRHYIDLAAQRFRTDDLFSGRGDSRLFGEPDLSSFPSALIGAPFSSGQEDYFIVQARSPEAQKNLRRLFEESRFLHIRILDFIPQFAFMVEMTKQQYDRLAVEEDVEWIGYFQPAWRVHPKLDYIIESDPNHEIGLTANFDARRFASGDELREELRSLKIEISSLVLVQGGKTWRVRLNGRASIARHLVLIPGCLWVERWVTPRLDNNIARSSSNIPTGRGAASGPMMDVEDVWARGIRGEGQIAAAADTGLSTGDLATLHQDFGEQGSSTNPMRVIKGYALGRTTTWDDNQTTGGGHGTHTSGSIVGNGFRSGSDPSTNYFPSDSFAGNAPKAQFVFQSVMDSGGNLGGLPSDLNSLFLPPYNDGARVHSNSWGAPVGGDYTSDSQDVDQFTFEHQDMVITFSAGNSGTDTSPGDGIVDTDSIGAPGTAKNCITVGASENYRPDFVYEYPEGDCTSSDGVEQKTWGWAWASDFSHDPPKSDLMADDASGMAAFSSRGPTNDGRIKPEVTAPGVAIISTRTDKNQAYEQWGICSVPSALRPYYMTEGGTSMANPLTAGAAVLVRQYYSDGWHANNSGDTNSSAIAGDAFNPSAALVKATLINGAWDMNPGQYDAAHNEIPPTWDSPNDLPNNVEGFGRVDLEHSLFPGSGWGDSSGRQMAVYDVSPGLATGEGDSYTFPISFNTNPLIVTLVWTDPYGATSAATELVNDLDLVVTSPGGTQYWPNRKDWTGGSADRKNNTEQVYVSSPSNGTWSISVQGYNVPGNGQSGSTSQPYALVISGVACDAVPPSGVSATANGDNRIDVSWNAATGATEYRVYRSTTSGGPYSQVGTVTAPSTSYSDTNVSGNVTYYYVVRTYTTCESPDSSEASAVTTGSCTVPPTFDGLQSVTNAQASTCQLDLSWNAATSPCGGTISYNIYRSTTSGFTPGAGNQIATGVSGTAYSDTDALSNGTTYYYIVRALSSTNGIEDGNTVEKSAAPTGASGGNQTLFSDDFETSADWANWTVTTGPGPHTCGDWARTNTTSQLPTDGSGYYALSDSDACGSGSQTSTILTSPVIDCSSVLANVSISYAIYYKYYNGDDATFEVWDGSSWVVIWSDTNADINTTHVWDVTSYAAGNANFQFRFNYQNAAWDYWYAVDDVLLTGDVAAACTPGSSCTDPGAVTIDSITDDDSCAQSGVTITFSGGSGATSFELWVDGAQAATGITSPYSYDPGDSSSHSYVVRAVDGSCHTDSSASSFTDADNTPATPGAPSVSDDDACVQSGVTVTWSAVSGATAYDLLVDGTTTISGVSSPYSYNPGDTNAHDYQVRARNATCTGAYSSATSATDAAGAPTAPSAPTVGDVAACALSGVSITWGAVTGATSYDLQIDGGAVVTGVTSPYTYAPGDSNSHSYAVRSVNSCGNSAWSSATTGVDADHSIGGFGGIRTAADRDACEDSGVTLSWKTPENWNDGGTGSRSFTIQRAGADLQTGIGESVTSGVDTTGANGTSYAYGVVAINGYGCTSGASTTLNATDNVGSAPSFTGLQSVAVDSGGGCSLHLEWNAASSGCSSAPGIVYDVYRSTSSGFTPSSANLLASCVSDLYYDDSSVLTGTTYYYVVRAEDSSTSHGGSCNGGWEDGNTAEVSGTLSSGSTVQVVFDDDFEGSPTPSGHDWIGATFSDDGGDGSDWHIAGNRVHNGSTSGQFGDGTQYYNDSNDALIAGCDGSSGNCGTSGMNGIDLPATATSITLSFWEWRDFETDYDGAMLMYSTTGALSGYNQIPDTDPGSGPYITAISYNGALSSICPPSATTAGVDEWTDNIGAWQQVTVNLDRLAGSTIWLAWRAITDCSVQHEGWYIDEVHIDADMPGTACTAGAPDPVEHLTARANSGAVKLEWVNSSTGYASTRICRDTTAFPSDPATCTQVYDGAGTAGAYDSFTDSGVTNGTTYYYTAWVNNGSGTFSTRETVSARPFATTGKTQWAYSSGASALAPNGVYPGAIGSGATFAVSNDRVLHGMNPTTAGGDWPRTSPYAWEPMAMNGPAQARPPVVPTTVVSGADMVVFLGSEDGHAYAANAKTGTTLWQSSALGSILLASPAGMFTAFGGSYDLVFIGSRDAGSGNSMYGLNASDGTTAWTFDNGGGANAIGIISSSAYVDYANNRLYFAGRENASGSNSTMWCLSLTGSSSVSLLWSRALGDIDGAPTLYDGVVYVGNNAGEVFALDPATGATKWSYATGDGAVKGYVYPQFQAVPRDVYFSTSGSVWALTDSGSSVSLDWQQATISSPSILLAVPGGTDAYVGSGDGKLYQLNISDGSVVTSLTIGDGTATVGNPVMDVINNMVYVGTESGAVYGVNLPLN